MTLNSKSSRTFLQTGRTRYHSTTSTMASDLPHYATQRFLSLAYTLSTLQATSICFGMVFFIAYLYSAYKSKTSPLSAIPGPWYAPYTTIHLRYLFAQGTIWKYAQQQHHKHGSVIRLGPRQVWVSDKVAMKDILLTTDLPKVSMYAEISRDRNSPGLFGEMYVMDFSNWFSGLHWCMPLAVRFLIRTLNVS